MFDTLFFMLLVTLSLSQLFVVVDLHNDELTVDLLVEQILPVDP